MRLYLDSDFFIAVLKPSDWLKEAAADYWTENRHLHEFYASSITLLEIWFTVLRVGSTEDAERAIKDVSRKMDVVVREAGQQEIEQALVISKLYGLKPADSIHASIAGSFDAIVSSDSAFDRVKGLKRIDFSKKR